MDFYQEHEIFVQHHKLRRSGERLRRLQEGHGYAEKLFMQHIWWPVVGHLRYLHPEYEVRDFQDNTRFVDFVYLRPPHRICIEIDGFGPHARDIDRTRFGDNLMRQNQLMLDDWKVLRFSVDDITGHQRRCQQVIWNMMGRWYADDCGREMWSLTNREKEITRLAASAVDPLKPQAVAAHLGIRVEHARKWLRSLHGKGIIKPASGVQRVRSYVLAPSGREWSGF
ncbi:DNA-binding response regulator [Paenibacillus sp. HWE-109]|uniref:DNA-binding response regulator n=1 Tax=Paenibacillus sp. HWE-109 TaxID=1306526 RepID=UPI001EDE1C74|nr:DNA-binding response regulator [Paenibacillus sp. HWE-109]UKS24872.1 DNA-binding response regulator [Paenibacillus sp. HWE-109]